MSKTMTAQQRGMTPWYTCVTKDPDASRTFYSKLFGWTTQMDKFQDGSECETFLAQGNAFADLAKGDGAVPSHWAVYVAVEDTNATAERAAKLGGKVLYPPFAVPGLGSMALLQDPTGGTLWAFTPEDASAMTSAMGTGEGRVCWHELLTPEPERAVDFYAQLFGWNVPWDEKMGMWLIQVNAKPVGHIMKTPAQAAGMPATWGVYFDTRNLGDTTATAEKLGAKVLMGATEVPDAGRFAFLRDPAGATFYLWQGK